MDYYNNVFFLMTWLKHDGKIRHLWPYISSRQGKEGPVDYFGMQGVVESDPPDGEMFLEKGSRRYAFLFKDYMRQPYLRFYPYEGDTYAFFRFVPRALRGGAIVVVGEDLSSF